MITCSATLVTSQECNKYRAPDARSAEIKAAKFKKLSEGWEYLAQFITDNKEASESSRTDSLREV